ncbi:MAG: hypothetical protein LBG65_02635 [Puniceicoccales bacterium]|jgi:hypothetical protein|nr:hypothetical protein [Puniceicoccales bacterium]
MIIAIQALGKYHKLLLGALLGITVVSFVFFGVWSGAQGGGAGKQYFGVNLNDPRAMEPYRDLAVFSGRRDGDVLQYIRQIALANQAQIPAPVGEQLRSELLKELKTADALGRLVETLVEVARRNGSPSNADATARVERYLSNTLRIRRLQTALAGPGYAVPHEAVLAWRLQNTLWEIETATLSSETFNPEIKPDDATLAQYYETVKEDYRIPPVVTASYAAFAPSEADFKDVPTTATEEELQAFILNNHETLVLPGLDFRKPEVRSKLDEHLKNRRADILKLWRETRAAENLAGRLSVLLEQLPLLDGYNEKQTKKFLEANHAAETLLPAFHKDNIPGDLPVPARILANIFELNNETWRSNVYPSGAKAIVFFHKKTLPARIPDLAEVRERALAAYVAHERSTLFNKHAIELGEKLKSALAAGKSLAEVATPLGFKLNKPAPFKTSEVPAEFYAIETSFDPSHPSALPGIVRYLSVLPEGGLTPVLKNGASALYARLLKKSEPAASSTAPEVQPILARATALNQNLAYASIIASLTPPSTKPEEQP